MRCTGVDTAVRVSGRGPFGSCRGPPRVTLAGSGGLIESPGNQEPVFRLTDEVHEGVRRRGGNGESRKRVEADTYVVSATSQEATSLRKEHHLTRQTAEAHVSLSVTNH